MHTCTHMHTPCHAVPIKVFSQFRKIRAISKSLPTIAVALGHSKKLEVAPDMKHVRRVSPIPQYDIAALQRRYVCVENLPTCPTIELVTSMFSEFGEISVVRIVARGESKGKVGGRVESGHGATLALEGKSMSSRCTFQTVFVLATGSAQYTGVHSTLAYVHVCATVCLALSWYALT